MKAKETDGKEGRKEVERGKGGRGKKRKENKKKELLIVLNERIYLFYTLRTSWYFFTERERELGRDKEIRTDTHFP